MPILFFLDLILLSVSSTTRKRRFRHSDPEDTSTIAVAKVQRRDKSQPEIAFHHGDFTLANGSYYPGNADLPWPIEVQQIARKGYCASRSFRIFVFSPSLAEDRLRRRGGVADGFLHRARAG